MSALMAGHKMRRCQVTRNLPKHVLLGQMITNQGCSRADVRSETGCWGRCPLTDKLLGRCPIRVKLLGQMSAQVQAAWGRCLARGKLLWQMSDQRQAARADVRTETSCRGICPLRDKLVSKTS